jgi:hypothetical protein
MTAWLSYCPICKACLPYHKKTCPRIAEIGN